jgi:hypothetical protein
MPASEKSNRALTTKSSSWSRPIVLRTGVTGLELTTGRVLCATTQSEHEAASVCVGWVWADSAATIHSIKDRQSQTGHLTQRRICDSKKPYESEPAGMIPHESFFTASRFGIRLP